MAFPLNTGRVIKAAYANADPLVNYSLAILNGPVRIVQWDDAAIGSPRPTDRQINDWANDVAPLPDTAFLPDRGKLFSEWEQQNGGDQTLTARRKSGVGVTYDSEGLSNTFRATSLALLDDINANTKRMNDAGIGTPTDLKSKPELWAQTTQQLESGNADDWGIVSESRNRPPTDRKEIS